MRALRYYASINATLEVLDAFSQSAGEGKGLEAYEVLKLQMEDGFVCWALLWCRHPVVNWALDTVSPSIFVFLLLLHYLFPSHAPSFPSTLTYQCYLPTQDL